MPNDTTTSIQLLDAMSRLLQQVSEWSQYYEAALHATTQVLYDWQAQSDTVRWAGATESLLGYERAALPATWGALQALRHPADRAAGDHLRASPSGVALTGQVYRFL
jgi:PAS domain-containing protein